MSVQYAHIHTYIIHIPIKSNCIYEVLSVPIKNWRNVFEENVVSGSVEPDLAFHWIAEARTATDWRDLQPVKIFLTLEVKIAATLTRIVQAEKILAEDLRLAR